MAIDPTAPITLRQLEDHLWGAADLFRNKVSNQKDYILALLFFKRACDLYAEETARGIEDLAGIEEAISIIEANPDAYHALRIPAKSFWADVLDTDKDKLGKALNDALAGIGRANPEQLSEVFESIDFNDKRALPADDLSDVLDHFNALGALTNERIPSDMLGQAYEWLIAKFAANAGKGGGEFYTPAQVGKLGARLLGPNPGEEGCDPTCGSGGLLLELLAEAHRLHGREARSVSVYGQELNPETWALARMNMLLHGAGGAATIVQGDTLASPAFRDGDAVRTFDLVIANPPFSSKNWGHDRFKAAGDPFGRINHLPPKSHGEMAFVQHMVASLNETGRMAVVLPNGCFFRGKGELAVRRELINDDRVEAIIQLPKDLFYGAGIPACWLIVNNAKPDSRAEKVLFMDASELFERVDTKNALRDEDIDKIVAAYQSDETKEGFSTFATKDEIKSARYNLSVRRYVRGADANGEVLALGEALAAFRDAQAARHATDRHLTDVLARLDKDAEDEQ